MRMMKIRVSVVLMACMLSGHAAAVGDFDEVMLDYRRGDFQYAHAEFMRLAEQGSLDAMFRLGVMSGNGEGTARDFQKSVQWYRQAAQRGHAASQNNLAIYYRDGKIVKQSPIMAYMWFNVAASTIPVAAENRRELAREMSEMEILQAQQLSADFTARIVEFERERKRMREQRRVALMQQIEQERASAQLHAEEVAAARREAALRSRELAEDVAEPQSLEQMVGKIPDLIKGIPDWLQRQHQQFNIKQGSEADLRGEPASAGQDVVEERAGSDTVARYVVQIGIFQQLENVVNIEATLDEAGMRLVDDEVVIRGNRYYRLRTGPYAEEGAAYAASARVDKMFDLESMVIPLF